MALWIRLATVDRARSIGSLPRRALPPRPYAVDSCSTGIFSFGLSAIPLPDVSAQRRVVDLVFQLLEPAPVGLSCLGVDHIAGVAGRHRSNRCTFRDQVKNVEFATGLGEKPRSPSTAIPLMSRT